MSASQRVERDKEALFSKSLISGGGGGGGYGKGEVEDGN